MAEKMTKNKMVEEIKNLTGELFEFELTEEQIEEIENSQEPKKANIKKLEEMLDAVATLETDGKKAVFKWAKLNGFYQMKLATVTSEKIKVGYKVSFRLDTKKVEQLVKHNIYYNDKNESAFDTIEFTSGQDVCTVIDIIEDNKIVCKSDNNGGMWYLWEEDINGKNNKKCVLKDGSGIAFLVYAPKEKAE